MLKWLQILVSLFLGLGTFPTSAEEKYIEGQSYYFEEVMVLSLSPFPPPSGIFATYVVVTISTPENEKLDLYYLFLSEDQGFPEVGEKCSVAAEAIKGQRIELLSVAKSIEPEALYLSIVEMKCESGTYPYPDF